MIVKSKAEIEDLLSRAVELAEDGSKFPGMSYEEGIIAALRWLTESDEPDPLEE
jgi:hypothetical protein